MLRSTFRIFRSVLQEVQPIRYHGVLLEVLSFIEQCSLYPYPRKLGFHKSEAAAFALLLHHVRKAQTQHNEGMEGSAVN